MGRELSAGHDALVNATPEQVWAAIATGSGIDSWFMGRNEVEPGETVRTAFGDYEPTHRVSAWEPGKRLAYGSEQDEDGRFVAYEFLIQGRDRSSTVLHMAASGFLPGDDWEAEYDAMAKGNALFFATLVTYLDHFAGRTATPVTAFGPMITDWERTRAALESAIGLSGDSARFTPEDLPPVAGKVYFANADTIGIRTENALYRFLRGFRGPVMACHHLFYDADTDTAERAWAAWLERVIRDEETP